MSEYQDSDDFSLDAQFSQSDVSHYRPEEPSAEQNPDERNDDLLAVQTAPPQTVNLGDLENERTWRKLARNPQFWDGIERMQRLLSVPTKEDIRSKPSWQRREGD